jgi:hypothetical protein
MGSGKPMHRITSSDIKLHAVIVATNGVPQIAAWR